MSAFLILFRNAVCKLCRRPFCKVFAAARNVLKFFTRASACGKQISSFGTQKQNIRARFAGQTVSGFADICCKSILNSKPALHCPPCPATFLVRIVFFSLYAYAPFIRLKPVILKNSLFKDTVLRRESMPVSARFFSLRFPRIPPPKSFRFPKLPLRILSRFPFPIF